MGGSIIQQQNSPYLLIQACSSIYLTFPLSAPFPCCLSRCPTLHPPLLEQLPKELTLASWINLKFPVAHLLEALNCAIFRFTIGTLTQFHENLTKDPQQKHSSSHLPLYMSKPERQFLQAKLLPAEWALLTYLGLRRASTLQAWRPRTGSPILPLTTFHDYIATSNGEY